MADKQIKVTAGLDEASFSKTSRLIQQLTKDVAGLVAATQKAAAGMGGMGGGATVSSKSAPSGTGSGSISSAIAGIGRGSGGGGVTGSLTKAVQDSANLFKAAATGSKDAFRIMQDSLRQSVDASDAQIKKLTQSLKGLEQTYSKLKSTGSGPLNAQALTAVQNRYYETSQAMAAARGERASLGMAQHGLDEQSGGYEYAKQPGFFKRAGAFMGGTGAGVAAALGIPPWLLGAGGFAGAAAGGLALAGKATQAAAGMTDANIGYAVDKPFFSMNAKAQIGSIFGGNSTSIRHGDMARVASMVALSDSSDFKNMMGQHALLSRQRDRDNANTWVGRVLKGNVIGATWDTVWDKVGSAMGNPRYMKGFSDVGTNTKDTVARDRAFQEQQTQEAQRYQQALEAKMQEDPGFNDRINRFYQGAVGNAGLARAAAIGGGDVKFGGKNGVMVDSVSLLKARALAQGYDTGEFVGSMQEMAATAGRRFLGHGTAMLGMKSGGLHNAASIFGMGAQFNGGGVAGGDAFMRTVQAGIGRGGMDVTAGSQVAAAGVGLMGGGMFAGTGRGMMSTLLDAGMTGTTGGDMLAARGIQAGIGAMGAMMSGSIDPLQQGLNASAALKAAPGASYITHQALMTMDPGTMMDAIKNKKVPRSLEVQGVTLSMIERYMSTQNGTAFARTSSNMFSSAPEVAGAVARYRKAGGLSYLKGMSNKAKTAELELLAPAMRLGGGAKDDLSAMGRLRIQAAVEGGGFGGGRGHGAHDSLKAKTTLQSALGAQATAEFVEGVKQSKEGELDRETFGKANEAQGASEHMRKAGIAAVNGGDAGKAINDISTALTNFVSVIKSMQNSINPGPVKAAPKQTSAR